MSIPGKEEREAVACESSNYFAGVPIKKRKFPLFRPPSPTSEELPCLSSLELKVSDPSSELSPLNADIAACSLGTSNANKYPVSDKKEESSVDKDGSLVGLDSNLLSDISQAPNSAMHSNMLATKEKLFLSAGQNMTGVDKLVSVQIEASAEQDRKILPDTLSAGRDCTPELFRMPKNIELSLGPEEPIFPLLTNDHTSGCSSQIPDKLDPSTLRLSLSQNNCASGCEVGDPGESNANSYAKRLSWDLNTTMDAWEAPSVNCDGPGTTDVRGSREPGHIDGAETLTISTAVPEFVSDAGEQFLAVTNIISSSTTSVLSPTGKYRCGDSLQLSLATVGQTVTSAHSKVSAVADSGRFVPNSKTVEGLISTSDTSYAHCDTVKSEPFTAEHDTSAGGNSIELLNLGNKVLEDKPHIEGVNSTDVNCEKVAESRYIKSEPVQESKGKQIMSDTLVEKVVLCQDSVSLSLGMSPQPTKQHPLGFYSSSEFSKSDEVPNLSESSTHVEKAHKEVDKTQEMVDQVASGMITGSLGHDNEESYTSEGMVYKKSPEGANTDNIERCKADGVVPSTSKYSDGFEFNEENTNILADILEDNNESDYGSEGNDDVPMNSEGNDDVLMNSEGRDDSKEDEYEDGEVREAPKHIQADKDGNEISGALDMPLDCSDAQDPNVNDGKLEDHGEISDDQMEEGADAVLQKATDKITDRDCSLQESSTVEETADRTDEERSIKPTGRSPPYLSGEIDGQKGHDIEELSDAATNGGQDIRTSAGQITNACNKGTDTPTLPNTELYHSDENAGKDNNSEDADKDAKNRVSRSRIINLPRASNVTSPSKPRFMSNRPFQSARGRDKRNDFEGGPVPPRRNRAEFYADIPQKFDRDRYQDLSFRNSGTKNLRGRGRGFRQHVEWDSERDFDADINYGPGSYRFPRYKRASAGGNVELEGNGYSMATSRTSGMGRGGRKSIKELSSSRQPSSRRRLSPEIRDGNGTRGTDMLRQFPVNVNSSRSTGEHSSDLVGPRDGGKFIRGLPKDVIDPTFSHPQPMNEGIDDQFVGGRNFSAAQRRGVPRNRSKSPVRSRTRSPGQWSPPRRRSSGGFVELQESTLRRSPTIYRVDRIRSPDRSCFTEDTINRRRGSPSYVARHSHDLRNVDSVSSNPNRRRPYDRVLPESTRRFDVTDPRERRGGDDFFRGPIRSSRLHEFGGEGRGDERRKFSERHGPVRSFRSSFNTGDGENFRFHEDVNRPFCPETDSKHTEIGDVREREFDRGINYKNGFASSRMRNLEDGGNYRHGGEVWHDDAFDDVPRVKRRNF